MKQRIIFSILALLFFLPLSAAAQDNAPSPASQPPLQTYLHSPAGQNALQKAAGEVPIYKDGIISFYSARNYRPVWHDAAGRELRDYRAMEKIIKTSAYMNGLVPEEYNLHGPETAAATDNTSNADALLLHESLLTNAVMHYINDIRTGRIKPENYDPMMFHRKQFRDLGAAVAGLLISREPALFLDTLAPPHEEYKKLRQALARYRDIQKEGGWPRIETDTDRLLIIEPGDQHEIIPQVRKRLSYMQYDGTGKNLTGISTGNAAVQNSPAQETDAKAEKDGPEHYDGKLARQIAEFQFYHGKKVDGVIGPETLAALNTPVEARIEQIAMALERWRWLPDDLGKKYVMLNIAAYHVRAVEDGEEVFMMPAIVGQVAHQTPVFSSVISNVKFHPDWTAPDSIARRYLIDKIQNDPNVVYRLGYQLQRKDTGEIISWERVNIDQLHNIDLRQYQFRQRPGINNALGLARFSIENDYSIFMHGTPATDLFYKKQRTFSSGCIRLQDPLAMAKFLLEDDDISEQEIETLYHLQPQEHPATTIIDIANDIPVYLTYFTVWIDQEDKLHFTDDVYGRDHELKTALQGLTL